MARSLRIQYPGAFYHVTSRGNNHKNIFESETHKEKFLSYIEDACVRYKSIVHCYCLMDNHYHLLIETPLANLSEVMRYINGSYTAYFNATRKSSGHLFQGRYRAIIVDKDSYALELSRYIHLNPVRAKVVNNPGEYKWSSFIYYTTKSKVPSWLSTNFILSYFGKLKGASRRKYKTFVESMIEKDYENPLSNAVASTILGDDDFVKQVKEKYLKDKAADRNIPALKQLAKIPVKEIVKEVSLTCKNEKLARKISIYLSHRYSGRSLREIGDYFGIGESAVSQSSKRFNLELNNDKQTSKMVKKASEKLANV